MYVSTTPVVFVNTGLDVIFVYLLLPMLEQQILELHCMLEKVLPGHPETKIQGFTKQKTHELYMGVTWAILACFLSPGSRSLS